ncbi:conserved membrane protein of unknown function [Candidatus Hydrogenisulfobacillus filiaventi]|uniref:AI-2E family transporter n=1 Tax=Candidatus Hydrogenisulfobacillus filiaventi TaxID=2707344 RepID=A0A6F8ZGE7_9FIRM|nr:AI-2E family transporter [Bacillota bacterium]CAB1129065.1 conserved membrane protein of unknown function [Candidatus Hydrogenisulfobacillus filiaventi]
MQSLPGSQRGLAERVRLWRDLTIVILGGVGIVWVLAWLVGHVASIVLILLLALLLETLLGPLVDRLSRVWRRPWAVLAVIVGAALVVFAGGGLVVAALVEESVSLVQRLPATVHLVSGLFARWTAWAARFGVHISVAAIESHLLARAGQISSIVLTRGVAVFTHLVGAVTDSVIILFITIYLLLDAERIHVGLFRLIPEPARESALAVEHTLARVVGGYIRAQLLLSVLVGSGFGFGSWLIGLPYPFIIGAVAAFFELIPLLGPVLGALLPLLLAAFGHPLVQVPEVLILLLVVHLLESQILGPRLLRSQVGLHPILSVLALMIGAHLGGLWGAVFAVPTAGIVVAAWIAAVRLWQEKVVLPSQRRRPLP